VTPTQKLFLARYGWIAAAALLAAAGIWARLWGIGDEPMWLDEGYSAYAAAKGWHFLWNVVPRYETHPPFYYSLLRGWTLIAGDGLMAHRMLGAIAGIAALPVAALAADRMARITGLSRGWTIAGAVGIVALSPMLVEMAREVRPYPLMILVYASALAALAKIAGRSAQSLPIAGRAYAAYLAAFALMLWLHNLGPLYGLALGLALLTVTVRRGMTRADWAWIIGGHAIVLLIWLPALLILLDQAPMWVKATWLKFSTANLWRRVTVIHAGPADDMRAAALLLAALGVAVLWRKPSGKRLAAMLLILAFAPVLLSLLISATVAPVFIPRTMTALAVPAAVLIAIGLNFGRGWLRVLPIAAILWLLGQQFAFDIAAREHPRRDWYRALTWLKPRFQPGDQLFAYPNEGALPFDRAARDMGLAMPSRAIPTEIPSLNPPPGSWYVSGSRGVPSLDQSHLRAIAEEPRTKAVPTIWLLRLGPWAYDKGDVFLIELSRGRHEVGIYRAGAIDIVGLRKGER